MKLKNIGESWPEFMSMSDSTLIHFKFVPARVERILLPLEKKVDKYVRGPAIGYKRVADKSRTDKLGIIHPDQKK